MARRAVIARQSISYPPPLSDLMYAGSDSFLYRSTDRGLSWQIITGHPKCNISDIKIGNLLTGYYVFTTTSDGIYRGYQGENWQMVYNIPSRTIVLDRQLCQYVYAIDNAGIIIRSTNQGNTWEQKSPPIIQTGWECIAINPFSATTIYVGHADSGPYKSIDAGGNWQYLRFKSGESNADTNVKDIDISPRNQNIVFCIINPNPPAGQTEIWKSNDAGDIWMKKLSNSNSEELRYFTISTPSPDTCFVL
jgi:photosystem II stability/assembly factor-like uncharacterized protein